MIRSGWENPFPKDLRDAGAVLKVFARDLGKPFSTPEVRKRRLFPTERGICHQGNQEMMLQVREAGGRTG